MEHQGAPDSMGHAHGDGVMHPLLQVKENYIPSIHDGVKVGGKPPINVGKVKSKRA